jgi:hypothetical protein
MEGNRLAASELLEANFDPENFAPPGLRWTLARGDNLEEKRRRVKKRYPEGELDVLPESTVLGFDEDTMVWRESPQAQWKLIEPQGFDWMDVPEAIAPSAESIAAETVLAIGTGGMSVPATVTRQAAGAVIGEGVEQIGQSISGTQAQTPLEISGEMTSEGMWSAVGGFAASPFAGIYNAMRGAGALRVGEEGMGVIRAANELDKAGIGQKLTPGLVTDNPAMQLQEKQSSALLPGFRRRYREMMTALDSAVRSSAPGNASAAMQDTLGALKEFSDYFLQRVPRAGTTPREAGQALIDGIDQYSRQSRITVSALYDRARKVAEPEFDFTDALTIAADLRAGAKGKISPAVDQAIKDLENIKGPIELPSGETLSVTDQVRNVRTDLWALKSVEPGQQATRETGQATNMYKAVTDALENPKNADPDFVNLWRAANDAARVRLTTLEKAPIMAIAKSESPFKLAMSYIRPGEVDSILAIRQTIGDGWDKFVDAAYGQLLKDPANAKKAFEAFDQETLDAFMPRNQQAIFRRVVDELDRIYSVGADNIARQQVTNVNFIDNLIKSGTPSDAMTLMRAANNTNNQAMRDSVRSAIVDWAWDGVVRQTKNGLRVNNDLLAGRINKLKDSGFWRLLSTEEKRIVSNAEIVGRAFQSVQDAGTSIQAAEAAKGISRFKAGAIASFVQAGLISRFYMSGMGRRLLIGSGLPNSNAAMLRVFAGALAQTSRPEDISSLAGEAREDK